MLTQVTYKDMQTERDYTDQNNFDKSTGHQHTEEFKTGYANGYQDGFDDAQQGVYKDVC